MVAAAAAENNGPVELSEQQRERAAALADLRRSRESSAGDLARDVLALQSVLVRALREEVGDADPDGFTDAVERLAEATAAVQGEAVEELVRARSRELEAQANTDPLTGLYNLRFLQRTIAELLDMHKRYDQNFALLLMDIDGLKRINDAHGHVAGDRVLMQVAMSVRRSVRSVDVPARLGGDEFCVLAPHQDAKSGQVLAERLANAVGTEVVAPDSPAVSISVGVVACPEHGSENEALIDIADRAMYRAKAAGENVALGEPGERAAEEAEKKR